MPKVISNITYAITACDEHVELGFLLDFFKSRGEIGNVYVQFDSDRVSKSVIEVLDVYGVNNGGFPLDRDFSKFRNNIYQYCKGDWIFFIDADECPSEFLMDNMYSILDHNLDSDMIYVPRLNIVDGITDMHIDKWGWNVSKKEIHGIEVDAINFPDYQMRIQKNLPHIRWIRKVHEILNGFKTYTVLPAEIEYSLIHRKNIKKQEVQNNFYDEL